MVVDDAGAGLTRDRGHEVALVHRLQGGSADRRIVERRVQMLKRSTPIRPVVSTTSTFRFVSRRSDGTRSITGCSTQSTSPRVLTYPVALRALYGR